MEKMDNTKTSAEVLLASLRLELLCPLCGELFREPVIGQCGHTFCRICANRVQQRSDQPQCPQCQGCLSNAQLSPNYVVGSVVQRLRDGELPGARAEASHPLCDGTVGQQGMSPPAKLAAEQAEECTPVRHPRPSNGVGSVDRAVAGESGARELAEGKSEGNVNLTPTGRPSMTETVPESPEGLFSLIQDLAAVKGSPLPSSSEGVAIGDRTAPPVFNRAWVEHFLSGPLPNPEQRIALELELAKLGNVIKEARHLLGVCHIKKVVENKSDAGKTQTGEGKGANDSLVGCTVATVVDKEEDELPGEIPGNEKSIGLSRFDSKTIQRNADIDAALKARGYEMGETIEPMEEEKVVGFSFAAQKVDEKLATVGWGPKSKDPPQNMAEMERRAAAVLSGRFSNSNSGAAPLEVDLDGPQVSLKHGGEGEVVKQGDVMSDMEMIGVEGLSNLQNFCFGEEGGAGNAATRGSRRLRGNGNGRRGRCKGGNAELMREGARQQGMDVIDEEGGLTGAGRKGRKNPEASRRRKKVGAGAKGRPGKKKICDGKTRDVTGAGDSKEADNKRGKARGNRKRQAEGNLERAENGGKSSPPPKKARRHRVVHKSVKKEEDNVRQCGSVPGENHNGVEAGIGQRVDSQPGGEVIERVSARETGTVVESEGGSGLTAAKGRKGKRRSSNIESSSGSKRQRPIDLVGQRVEIYWDGMECWYRGKAGEFCPKEKKYRVEYEDGEIHWESLPNSQKGKRWRLSKEENGSPSMEVSHTPVNCDAPRLVAVSDLAEDRRTLVRAFCESHGAIMVDDVSSNTTHLVVGPVEGNRAKKRTEKLMRAVLHGCAIVSWGWIEASVNTGAWMSENDFLLQGDVKSKVDWRGVKMDRPLFTGMQFAVEPSKGKLRSLVEELILIGGGCVLRKPAPKGEDAKFSIVCVGQRSGAELRAIQAKWGKSALRHEWIFDSVSAKSLLPQDDYQS